MDSDAVGEPAMSPASRCTPEFSRFLASQKPRRMACQHPRSAHNKRLRVTPTSIFGNSTGMHGRFAQCFSGTVVALCLLTSTQPLIVAAQSVWSWPLSEPLLIRTFDPPVQKWNAGHRGVDLAAHAGEPVYASGAGVVVFAGTLAGRGVVSIMHGSVRTTYEPVKPTVHVGDFVVRADLIGNLAAGTSHCSQSYRVRCLHWGLIRGDTYLNPLLLVKGRIHLLPLSTHLPK